MDRTVVVENHGPIITATNYWSLPPVWGERFYVSINASAFRLLLRPEAVADIPDMAMAKECVVSRGPYPGAGLADALEIFFDGGSDHHYAVHTGIQNVDRLPLDSDAGREWTLSVWIPRGRKPREVLTRPCWYRRVPVLPCLVLVTGATAYQKTPSPTPDQET